LPVCEQEVDAETIGVANQKLHPCLQDRGEVVRVLPEYHSAKLSKARHQMISKAVGQWKLLDLSLAIFE